MERCLVAAFQADHARFKGVAVAWLWWLVGRRLLALLLAVVVVVVANRIVHGSCQCIVATDDTAAVVAWCTRTVL